MKSPKRKLKHWKYKGDWPIIREVLKGDRIKYKVDTTTRLGRREQKVHESKEIAETHCEQYRVRLKNNGLRAFDLGVEEQADALEALSLCRDLGFSSLTDALKKLALYHRPVGGACTVKELRDEFLEHYEKQVKDGVISLRTLRSYRSKTGKLSDKFRGKQIRELTGDIVWGELKRIADEKDWERGTLDSYVSVWRVLFAYALKTERIIESPLDGKRISFEITEATRQGALPPPVIMSIPQTKRLLYESWNMRDRGMLQAVVVLIFAGLRPDAEMLKLTWDHLELENDLLNVGGDRSKREVSARTVKLCPAAILWLKHCDRTSRFKPMDWKRNWKRVRDRAGFGDNWVEDMTRHSFASYTYADHRDSDRLRRELGHIDERMLNHYRQVSSKVNKNAEHYLGLTPDKVLTPDENKVIPMELVS